MTFDLLKRSKKNIFSRSVFAVIVSAMLLTSCEDDDIDRDSYRIFSDGTYIEVDTGHSGQSKKNDDAAFYIPKGMTNNYFSINFSDDEKEVYDQILKDLGTFKEQVISSDNTIYNRMLNAVRIEQLAYTQVSGWDWVYNTDTQSLDRVFQYRLTADQVSSMNIAAEKAAKEIMSGITEDMDDYEKLKYFHDWLVLNCDTDTDYEYSDTIYGALVKKEAMCEGYAKAFAYLCNLAGIENTIVVGETDVPHMWNMVKLGGNWYHVDVTWDDADNRLHEKYPNVILYQYFMITDSVLENNHIIWNVPSEPPKANGRNENYFAREGTDVSSEDEFFTAAENAIMNAVSRGEQGAMVKFETSDLFISTAAMLMNDKELNSIFDPIISRAEAAYGKNVNVSWTDYYAQYRIITFIIEYN